MMRHEKIKGHCPMVNTVEQENASLHELFVRQMAVTHPAIKQSQERAVGDVEMSFRNISPNSEVERMLISQIIATHNLSMNLLSKSSFAQDDGLTSVLASASAKLMKVFCIQLNTLEKLRNQGQQKVIVEHVHVHQRGQAIVGQVGGGV